MPSSRSIGGRAAVPMAFSLDAARTDQDALLAGSLQMDGGEHLGEVGPPIAGAHLVDGHGDGMRQLVTHAVERRLTDKFGHADLDRFIGIQIGRVEPRPGRELRDEQIGEQVHLVAGDG